MGMKWKGHALLRVTAPLVDRTGRQNGQFDIKAEDQNISKVLRLNTTSQISLKWVIVFIRQLLNETPQQWGSSSFWVWSLFAICTRTTSTSAKEFFSNDTVWSTMIQVVCWVFMPEQRVSWMVFPWGCSVLFSCNVVCLRMRSLFSS